MKNIQIYQADKYSASGYTKVEENIYKGRNPFCNGNIWERDELYLTSLMFEQEPEFGEGDSPEHIPQYPLEDILDMFYASVTDFYKDLNAQSKDICYLEFGTFEIEDIRKLLGIVGKHVYQKKVFAEHLSEEELESCKGMTKEELEEEGFISYKTVIE